MTTPYAPEVRKLPSQFSRKLSAALKTVRVSKEILTIVARFGRRWHIGSQVMTGRARELPSADRRWSRTTLSKRQLPRVGLDRQRNTSYRFLIRQRLRAQRFGSGACAAAPLANSSSVRQIHSDRRALAKWPSPLAARRRNFRMALPTRCRRPQSCHSQRSPPPTRVRCRSGKFRYL